MIQEFTMRFATSLGLDALAEARKLLDDAERESRIAANLCVRCYYPSWMSGQSITKWACGFCGTEAVHPNTGIPRLCQPCAAKHGLCAQCAADRELQLRTEWPTNA